jgi:flagellar protein FliS
MAYTNFDRYLEAEVFSADPVKLVCMLYRGAIEATAAARRHLKAGHIPPRSREILRAHAILRELSHSLDPQYEISRTLRELYAYMQMQLLTANSKQMETPLAEVEQLLSTLLEGWKAVAPVAPAVVAESAYQPMSCTY